MMITGIIIGSTESPIAAISSDRPARGFCKPTGPKKCE